MGLTKIQDEQEVIRWIAEGKPYQWMVDEYLRKYNLEVSRSMFANFRKNRGLPRRITRDDKLLPWEIKPEHRYSWAPTMLRFEARRRAGIKPLSEREEHELNAWLAGLERDNAVVHYDPDTEQGWFLVPPRKGIDNDLIREPDRRTTRQRNADEE